MELIDFILENSDVFKIALNEENVNYLEELLSHFSIDTMCANRIEEVLNTTNLSTIEEIIEYLRWDDDGVDVAELNL